MMPVFNLEGQILLKEKHQIAMSPNGHGGCLRALLQSAALDIMEDEGIDTISYFQIDNPMVYCLDPLFLGYHQATQSEMSSKAVQKVDGNEKVGTFIKNRKKLHVMEYSDISKEISHKKDNHGELCFRLGNIAIHLLNRDFVKNIATAKGGDAKRLRYHGALKKVSYLDDAGRKVSPKEPNAIKAETFVFDALPYAQNPLVLEIDRGEEFAPIKNAQGSDSLETSQNLQIARGRKWLKAVGLTEPRTIEISPTFAPTFTYFKEIMSNLEINNQSLSSNELYWDEYGPSPKPNNNQTKYK